MTKLRISAADTQAKEIFEEYLTDSIEVLPDDWGYAGQVTKVEAAHPSYFKGDWYTVVKIYYEFRKGKYSYTGDTTFEVSILDSSIVPTAMLRPTPRRINVNVDMGVLGELLQNWVLS